MKDEYNEMMDQYEKDRREQTHTWICKDAVMNELDKLMQIIDEPAATRVIIMVASSLNNLPEHRFSLMDEVKDNETD